MARRTGCLKASEDECGSQKAVFITQDPARWPEGILRFGMAASSRRHREQVFCTWPQSSRHHTPEGTRDKDGVTG